MNDKIDIVFNQNEDNMKLLVSEMKQRQHVIEEGGGKVNIEKQHQKGKLTARERVKNLLDKDSNYIEIGTFAAYDLYNEFGGCVKGRRDSKLLQFWFPLFIGRSRIKHKARCHMQNPQRFFFRLYYQRHLERAGVGEACLLDSINGPHVTATA